MAIEIARVLAAGNDHVPRAVSYGSVLQRVAACCSVLQRVAACCSVSVSE